MNPKRVSARRLCLKVDCDTFEGSKNGIPTLLKLFERYNVRATFYFMLGPDTTGRAIFRVFTRKGFLKSMLKRKAVSLYGPKTIMYGTLLRGPVIGKELHDLLRSVYTAGHEVGIHGWDHIRWHDRLDKMTPGQIRDDVGRSHNMFEDIFGFKARSSGAPGWHATADSWAVQDAFGITHASDTRGGAPCFIEMNGRRFKALEIPSTLPTWDEALDNSAYQDETTLLDYYRDAIRGTEVHSIHTEIEGTTRAALFEKQLQVWTSHGISFLTLNDYAAEQLSAPDSIPVRSLRRVEIPFRTGQITSTV